MLGRRSVTAGDSPTESTGLFWFRMEWAVPRYPALFPDFRHAATRGSPCSAAYSRP